jgi:RNA-directed DNA polymerase
MNSAKPFSIAKSVVWEAYKRVKANRGAAGIDEQSIEMFEANLGRNLYKLWNRMSSGSYYPPAVRRAEIPKKAGGKRVLGIPTVTDRIAQMVVKIYLEPRLDPLFVPDSYGYRPGKSAQQAVAVTRTRCWHYDWVVEFDIQGAFDNIDHELLMKAIHKHVGERWQLLYIERWLTAPYETSEGTTVARKMGTPQGGVISPLLMNLFMHYAFDQWMQRTYPQCPYARYADDAVVHCRSREEAERVLAAIGERMGRCRLALHPEKSGLVYCQDSNRGQVYSKVHFTFLGFTFRPRVAIGNTGRSFTSFLPAVSREAIVRMRQRIRSWKIQRQTPVTLADLAQKYEPILRGWWNYYASFYKTEMRKVFDHFDRALTRWARRKYKRFVGHHRRSVHWLRGLARKQPRLFYHWSVFGKPAIR